MKAAIVPLSNALCYSVSLKFIAGIATPLTHQANAMLNLNNAFRRFNRIFISGCIKNRFTHKALTLLIRNTADIKLVNLLCAVKVGKVKLFL
jgi:hypothetical protein